MVLLSLKMAGWAIVIKNSEREYLSTIMKSQNTLWMNDVPNFQMIRMMNIVAVKENDDDDVQNQIYNAVSIPSKYKISVEYMVKQSVDCQKKYGGWSYDPYKNGWVRFCHHVWNRRLYDQFLGLIIFTWDSLCLPDIFLLALQNRTLPLDPNADCIVNLPVCYCKDWNGKISKHFQRLEKNFFRSWYLDEGFVFSSSLDVRKYKRRHGTVRACRKKGHLPIWSIFFMLLEDLPEIPSFIHSNCSAEYSYSFILVLQSDHFQCYIASFLLIHFEHFNAQAY